MDQALELANLYHPQLEAGAARVDAARAGIRTAQAYPNPEFSTGVGRQIVRVPGNVPGNVAVFGFSQPLELGEIRPTRIKLAERTVDTSELVLALTRLGVLSGVRRAFFEALRRKGEIGIAEENLKLVEDLRQRIKVRVDVGEAGRLELIRADAEVAQARTLLNTASLRLVTAVAQFRAAVGATLADDIVLDGSLDPPLSLPPVEELEQQARERHPALVLARSEVRRSEARIAYEQALRRPQPSLRSDVERYPDVPNFRFGISVPLPFWNKREGPIAEAVAEQRQYAALARAREFELLSVLEGAYGRYQLATQQLAAFEQGLFQEAQEAVRAAETAYQLGERGILDVLDAQRVLRNVRLDFLNAQYDRQAALVDLDELRAVDPLGKTDGAGADATGGTPLIPTTKSGTTL
ncbi:MAG: TolC family protein [Bryobacteraceae bacterium]